MAKKFEMKANSDDGRGKVDIVGLDVIFDTGLQMENLLCKYERFTEDVLLACVMPENPRYVLEYDEDDTMMGEAHNKLQKLLVRYRKLVTWMRSSGISVESVCGDDDVMMMKS